MNSGMSITILVVDDEPIARDNLRHVLEKDGYRVLLAKDGQEALNVVGQEDVQLVLTDMRMKGIDGLTVLEETKKLRKSTEVVVITGYASVETAIQAMRKGAYHYLAKPVNMNELRAVVEKALEKNSMSREIEVLRQKVDSSAPHRIIGCSEATRAMRERIAQVAQLDCNVLILGETGTGKELVARTIHELSPRASKRFVAFNCGVFNADLLSSELFGHEQGAFTGAGKIKKGLVETADGGSVLFDEVGELSLPMQVKLLRVLQERLLMRVGGTAEIPVDIRVLAATNKDLKKEVELGTFRADLFYRLDVITIQVPSLSERKDDIPLLVEHFIEKHATRGRPIPAVSTDVLYRLKQYEYPGNIRELENIVQRLLINCEDDTIELRHLQNDMRDSVIVPTRAAMEDYWPTLEEHEKNYIQEVLSEVAGNKSQASKILGIDRVSLWRKIKRYGLDNPD